MQVQPLGPAAPAAVHITTGRYAFSRNGAPMATNGLMGCMAVIVHDPTNRRGCLGHVEPERDMSTFLARCIHLMGVADDDCASLELAFIGGRRGDTFAQDVVPALNDNLLTAMNALDGRRGAAAPFVGERILAGSSVTYHPATGRLYVGDSPLVVPRYDHAAVTHEVLTAGLNMHMMTSATLGN